MARRMYKDFTLLFPCQVKADSGGVTIVLSLKLCVLKSPCSCHATYDQVNAWSMHSQGLVWLMHLLQCKVARK